MDIDDHYRSSDYLVWTDQGILTIKVGDTHPAIDRLIGDHLQWAYITAHNPQSKQLTSVINARRHLDLVNHVSTLGFRYWYGQGQDSGASWVEDSILIAGITAASARVIGQRYDQNAILVGTVSGIATLQYL